MVITDSNVYYDPYDVEINADPYPTYARLRDEAPIYHNERYDFWFLSRHEDVQKALVNWRVFTSTHSDILDIMKANITLPKGVVMFEDPPVHTAQRGLPVAGLHAETDGPVRRSGPPVLRGSCLDPLVGSDGFDIITELGTMLPMRVIGMLLGIPEQDQVAVRNKTDNLRTKPGKPMVIVEDAVANGEMFADYIDWRAQHPSDDLMTVLLNAEFEDDRCGNADTHAPGGPHLYLGPGRSGQRDHRTSDRLAGQGAGRTPRSAARSDGRTCSACERHRRDLALRTHGPRHRSLRHRGYRVLRSDRAGRKPDPAVHGLGEPRPATIRESGRLRHLPQGRAAPHLRLRPPLLPRLAPGPARGSRGVGRDATGGPSGTSTTAGSSRAQTSTVRGWERMPIIVR